MLITEDEIMLITEEEIMQILACGLLVLAYIAGATALAVWIFPFRYDSPRKKWRKYLSILLLALSVLFLQSSIMFGQQGGDFWQRWTNAWARTFGFFSLDASYADIIENASTGGIAFPTVGWLYAFDVLSCIYVILVPIVGGAFFFDLFTSLIPRARLLFNFKRTKFVFSELNERSVALADDIARLSWQLHCFQRKNHPFEKEHIALREMKWIKSACIIFTDAYADRGSERSSELLARAKRIGAICLKDDILERAFHWCNLLHKKIVYFLMDHKTENNFTTALSLLDDKSGLWKAAVKHPGRNGGAEMYVFTQEEQEAARLFSEARQKLNTPGRIHVKCVNEYKNIVYQMFDDINLINTLLTGDKPEQFSLSPLFSLWDSFMQSRKEEIKIVILGAGRLAKEYLKTAAWCLQMLQCLRRDNDPYGELIYKTIPIKIVVFAEDATKLEQQLKGEIGDLLKHDCKAEFFDDTFLSEDLINDFKKVEALRAQRYLVALGDDTLNYNAAMWLRREIKKQNSVLNRELPCIIDYAIENNELVKKIEEETKSVERGIYMHPFGTMEQRFVYKNVRMDELEYRALQADRVHKTQPMEHFLSEYDHASSVSVALHTLYKLFSLQVKGRKRESMYKMMISGTNPVKDCENQIYWLEHRRWCAYTRTLGYTCPTAKQFVDYAFEFEGEKDKLFIKSYRGDKDEELRLHACLLRSNAVCQPLIESLLYVVRNWYVNNIEKGKEIETILSSDYPLADRIQKAKKKMADKIDNIKKEIIKKHMEKVDSLEEDEDLGTWLSKVINIGKDNNKLDALDRLSVLATLILNEEDMKKLKSENRNIYFDFKEYDIGISRGLYREVLQLRVKKLYNMLLASKHSIETEDTLKNAMKNLLEASRGQGDRFVVSYGENTDLILFPETNGKSCFGTLCKEDAKGEGKQKTKKILRRGILGDGCRLVEVPRGRTVCLGKIKKEDCTGRNRKAVFMHLYQGDNPKIDKEKYQAIEHKSSKALSKKRLYKILYKNSKRKTP